MKIFFQCFLLLITAVAVQAQGKIEIVGGDTYDFGKVKPKDSPYKATVRIKNIGNQLLHISGVKPGCGCTATKLDKDSLQPDEVASVDISLNAGSSNGHVTKTVTISSNDPENGTKLLYLKAEVVKEIIINPMQIAFVDLSMNKKSTFKVSVKNNSSMNIKFTDFEGTNNLIVSKKGAFELKPGAEQEIEVSHIPTTEGYYSAMLKMKTTHPDYPTLEVQAYGNVLKPESPVYQK